MKVSLNWLTDYVDISVPVEQLGQLLTDSGLSLEELIESETDIVLDLDVTSNRPDCLGHLGVAREIAAVTGAKFTPPTIGKIPTSGEVNELASVEVLAPDMCPRYTARVIRDVQIGPSPQWLVERLEAIGLRSVNNVVDVTNYVLMEYSQPLHSFDSDKLAGKQVVVRRAKAGEVMVSIDQTTCRLDEDMLIIADAEKAVAIAGVMGGLDTEVSAETVNLLIESAQFDPLAIRRTSRRLQLMSESNFRFERGVDPVAVDAASLRACEMIVELAGGTLAEGLIDIWAKPWQQKAITLRPARCDALLGVPTPVSRQKQILARLDLAPEEQGEALVCKIPPHRSDLRCEADLIEEVGRIEGYGRIPTSSQVSHAVVSQPPSRQAMRSIGRSMTAAGFDEAISSTFVDAEEARLFGQDDSIAVDAKIRKTNNALRATLLPSLLRACKVNHDAGNSDVSLFELASVFGPGWSGHLPQEHVELAAVTTRELRDIRGAIQATATCLDPEVQLSVAASPLSGFAPGMSGEILVGGNKAGVIGMIDPGVLDHYGMSVDRPIAAAAISFAAIAATVHKLKQYKPLSKFPAVRRDLSLIVDEDVTWNDLAAAIADIDQPIRSAVEYVTTYRGRQIPAGRKSVTIQITYRSDQGTLRGEQADQQADEVVSKLKDKINAELRT